MREAEQDIDRGEVTRLLAEAGQGRREAYDQLFPLVYEELKRIARRQMRRERAAHTLLTTGLVHEAYLKFIDQARLDAQSRVHFYNLASRAMRQVLVDHARRKAAAKRGGEWARTTLDEQGLPLHLRVEELLALDVALERLEQVNERLRRVVEYRYFCGLSEEEIGRLLGLTPRTVQRDWIKARAFLYAELYPEAGPAKPEPN